MNSNKEGHYEEKTVFIIPWGLITCIAAFSLGPFYIGTGLAFLMIPAQLSTLLLIPAYKAIKVKTFISDKKEPTTKISNSKEKEKNIENSKDKENSFVNNLQNSKSSQRSQNNQQTR